MRLFTLFLILTLIIVSPVNAETKGETEIIGLRGPVKSVSFEMAHVLNDSGKWIEGERFGKYVYSYDEKGNKIESFFPFSSKKLKIKSEMTYNEKGNLVEKKSQSNDSSNPIKEEFLYDKQWNLLNEIHYVNGKIARKISYKYNENGELLEKVSYANDGTIGDIEKYKYDLNGKMIETLICFEDGSISEKFSFDYNNKGDLISKIYSKGDGTVVSKEAIKYDDKGRLAERIIYSFEVLDSKEMYDEKGNPIEKIYYKSDGSFRSKWTYTYEYDSNGNWTKQTEYKDSVPVESNYRTITYYSK